MSTLSYIGVGVAPYGCSVITVFKHLDIAGKYIIRRLWNKNQMTYKGICEEIIKGLKTMELTDEQIKTISEKAQQEYRLSNSHMYEASHTKWLNHYYSIVGVPDGKLQSEVSNINLKYTQKNQTISYEYSEPKTDIYNSLVITSSLINDGMVDYVDELDLSEIKKEIDSLVNPENIKNLSPQLIALSLSIGEAEYRRLNDCEDNSFDIGAYAQGMMQVVSALSNRSFLY